MRRLFGLSGATVVGVLLAMTFNAAPAVAAIQPADFPVGPCMIVKNPTSKKHTECQNLTLSGLDFSGLDLSYANFSGTDLDYAFFASTTLVGANLSNTSLEYTQFIRATLDGANLTGADFSHADFSGANASESSLCPPPRLVSADGQPVPLTSRGAPINATIELTNIPQPPTDRPIVIIVKAEGTDGFSMLTGLCTVQVVQPPLATWKSTTVSSGIGKTINSTLGTITAHPSARVNATGLPNGVIITMTKKGAVTMSGTSKKSGTFTGVITICNKAAVDPSADACINHDYTLVITAPDTPTPDVSDNPQNPDPLPATGSTSPALVALALALICAGVLLRRGATRSFTK